MEKILKILNHELTDEQLEDLFQTLGEGFEIVELKDLYPELWEKIINSPDNIDELMEISERINRISDNFNYVIFPAGSPALMWCVAEYAKDRKYYCLFSHTERQMIETQQPDGSVIKKAVFRHVKWIIL